MTDFFMNGISQMLSPDTF